MHVVANVVAAALAVASLKPQAVSAPITGVRYEIAADSANLGIKNLAVAMTFRVASTKPVVLALPAWAPGWYQLTWFAKQVSHFDAQSNGQPLEWRKVGIQAWEIRPTRPGAVRISFDYATGSSAGASSDFAYFTGGMFLYPQGLSFDWPARVTVHTEPGWRVTSAMESTDTANTFSAPNYHDLLDMPFYVGRFDIDSTRIANRWIRYAMRPAGALTTARRDRALNLLGAATRQDSLIFGEVPFGTYTLFVLSDSTVGGGGGLEHQNSQFDNVELPQLDSKEMLDIFAHELMHAWNVKRLRPAEMVPYRYDVPQPTTMLWVSEGVTDYYAIVTLSRSVPSDTTTGLQYLGRWLFQTDAAPPTALGDVSVSTWIATNLRGPEGLYYPKGALMGFLLDVLIRDASDNRHSLDDVMRQLYQGTYKHGVGFTRDDWWSAVARNAGGARAPERFQEFARRYVDGREPLPLDSIFALAGLGVEWKTVPDTRSSKPNATRKTVRVFPMPAASPKAVAIRRAIFTR